jgi:cyanoexosortase A
MKADYGVLDWIYNSKFWVSVLGITLLILHIQLPYLLTANLNNLILSLLAWGGAIYLIWQRRKDLPLGHTDIVSGIIGTGLIVVVLTRSWFIQGNPDFLFSILPLFSAIGLVLLYSGIKSLWLFKRELAMVIISVIPTVHLMPYIDRVLNFSLLAAKFSFTILYYTGFEVTRQNAIVSLPNGAIEVYSGCSGLPAIILLLQLGALFVIFHPVSRILLILLPLLGSFIAFSVNGIRIVIMALLINAQDKPAFEYWHGVSGAQIFSLISMILFCLICEWIWERSHLDPNLESS